MQKLSVQTLAWAPDWTALFGADRPLILEIGFGRGAFLLHLARTNPHASVIGVEISNRCLTFTEAAIEREHLTNVQVVYATAQAALHHLFTSASLAQVHINFPDPWFKQAHHHRRLMTRTTLDLIVDRLTVGGEFYLATDIHDYAVLTADLLEATPALVNRLPSRWVSDYPERGIVTKYEAKAQREGRPCCYFAYQRIDAPAPTFPVIGDLPMPHIVLRTPLSMDELRAQFEPQHVDEGDLHIHLFEVYRGREALLFETHISEPSLDQRIALMLLERAADEYTIQLNTLGHPRATLGVHRAVKALADWIISQHPDGQVISAKINRDD